MKFFLLLLGLLSLPLTLAGCGSFSCTELGCADQLNVTLKGFASTYAADLPLTINLAVDGDSALDATVDGVTCTSCDLAGDGSVSLQIGVAFANEDGHAVHVLVKGKDGKTLFDESKPLTITSSEPNGSGCGPTCHQPNAVSFAP
ncbi:MAG: hypothetical protein ABI193_19135 [Minicystis sp.]